MPSSPDAPTAADLFVDLPLIGRPVALIRDSIATIRNPVTLISFAIALRGVGIRLSLTRGFLGLSAVLADLALIRAMLAFIRQPFALVGNRQSHFVVDLALVGNPVSLDVDLARPVVRRAFSREWRHASPSHPVRPDARARDLVAPTATMVDRFPGHCHG